MGLGCGQNEGSFGCEAVAFALGQPNVPECGRIFLFCLSAANFHYRCRFFQLAPNGLRIGDGGAFEKRLTNISTKAQ